MRLCMHHYVAALLPFLRWLCRYRRLEGSPAPGRGPISARIRNVSATRYPEPV